MKVAPTYWILNLPASMSFWTVEPTVCSKLAQIGQRESSYSSSVFLAVGLADDDGRAVRARGVLRARRRSSPSFAASQCAGLVGLHDGVADAARYREDHDGRADDDELPADLVLLRLALALLAQPLAGGGLVGLVVACAHGGFTPCEDVLRVRDEGWARRRAGLRQS